MIPYLTLNNPGYLNEISVPAHFEKRNGIQ